MGRVREAALGALEIGRRYGVDPLKGIHAVRQMRQYRRNRRAFESSGGTAMFPHGRSYPCLNDRRSTAGTAKGQYFHQDLLVAQWVFADMPQRHIDVGSRVDGFVAHLASFMPVVVLDIRPLTTSARNLRFVQRDIMESDPTWDAVADSVSCLHTIEHFGLGRYGDRIDPDGWRLGWENVLRIGKPGATIYLSSMIGPQRVEFDAHRIFSGRSLLELVAPTCEVERLAIINDHGELIDDVTQTDADDSWGCTSGCLVMKLRKRNGHASAAEAELR